MNRRLVVAYVVLFVLGAAVLPIFPEPSTVEQIFTRLVCLGLLAGIIEAVAIRSTRQRRWIWAWLPPVAGVLTNILMQIEYRDPDIFFVLFGLAQLLLPNSFVFAAFVHVTATCMLWLWRSRNWPKRLT